MAQTITKSMIKFMEDLGFGTFGTNLYVYQVPDSKFADNDIYWLIPSGGTPTRQLYTWGKTKRYAFIVHYRNESTEVVDDKMFEMESVINAVKCPLLEGFDVYNVQCDSFPTDSDLDSEDRMVGTMTIFIELLDSHK